MRNFNELVQEELMIAREKHGPINSIHEGYSVILEELDEVWDEVKKKTNKRDLENLLKELIQVSAMAQKMAEDVVMPLVKNKITPFIDPEFKTREWQSTPIVERNKNV